MGGNLGGGLCDKENGFPRAKIGDLFYFVVSVELFFFDIFETMLGKNDSKHRIPPNVFSFIFDAGFLLAFINIK